MICCRGTAREALQTTRDMMTQLRLTINDRKTRICRVPGETVALIALASGLEIGIVLLTLDEELVERYGHGD